MQLLADVNVWIPLVMSNHRRHEEVVVWFDRLRNDDVVFFCRATQQGMLRLMTDRNLFKEAALSNERAWRTYQTLLEDVRIGWVDEPEGLEEMWSSYALREVPSTKIWMDAYLAAVARLHRMRLVSFDKGFRVYEGLDWLDLGTLK